MYFCHILFWIKTWQPFSHPVYPIDYVMLCYIIICYAFFPKGYIISYFHLRDVLWLTTQFRAILLLRDLVPITQLYRIFVQRPVLNHTHTTMFEMCATFVGWQIRVLHKNTSLELFGIFEKTAGIFHAFGSKPFSRMGHSVIQRRVVRLKVALTDRISYKSAK